MKATNILLAVCIVAGIAFLSSLGFWQVSRLAQKEALIASVEQNLAAPARPLSSLQELLPDDGAIEYRPVMLRGRYLDNAPAYYFTTVSGRPGFTVYQPLQLAPGEWSVGTAEAEGRDILLVNRGFIEYDRRTAFDAEAAPTADTIQIEGLARGDQTTKPGRMLPDNDPGARLFYWKTTQGMAEALGLDANRVLPFFVDAGRPGEAVEAGTEPRPGTTLVTFSNSHLQYAVTWFGLAGALAAVGGAFLIRRIRGSDSA